MRKFNQKGSVLVFFTLAFPLLATFIGFALDFGRAYLEKARIARLVDGAALASAKVLQGQVGFEDEATRAACDSMVMNGAPVSMVGTGTCAATTGANFTVTVEFIDAPVPGGPPIRNVRITGTEPVPTTFLRFLGFVVPQCATSGDGSSSCDFSTITVAATAQAGPERPIDLMLVLDRSGSMKDPDATGDQKINALKTAVNQFVGLANTFSANDRIGMVSFATRGCGNNGQDSTAVNCTPDVPMDFVTSSFITTLQSKVNGLVATGGTNTMEALRTARLPLAQTFDDSTRSTTRKAVLLITDGQPTFMKLNTPSDCQNNPKTGSPLPSPGDTGGPNGCKLGVHPIFFDRGLRQTLTNIGTNDTTDFTQFPSAGGNPQLYQDIIRCTRALINCVTKGAMYEANLIRNCGFNNSSCTADGAHDILFFAIAIGKKDLNDPQSSVDENAKCLLARMANATDIVNVATGVVETMSDMCNGKFQSIDVDTHADLVEGWPCGAGPCIDTTQRKGKVYIVDVTGDVNAQLKLIFQEIASLLKLRLVI